MNLLRTMAFSSGHTLSLGLGDVTVERVDAVVNAANSHLAHGAGVAGAIVRRGGDVIQEESNAWVARHGPVRHAEPAVTRGGAMPCRYVIHAVGPVWGEGDEDAKLAAAVRGSLRRADELGLSSIAFPAISTGIYGFPKARAARVIYAAIQEYFSANPASGVKDVRLVMFDQPTLEAFMGEWAAGSGE